MWKALSLIAANEFGGTLRSHAVAFGIHVLAGVVALVGSVFGLLALRTWLGFHVSEIEASLIIAAVLLVLALIITWVGFYYKRRPRPATALTSTALVAVPLAASILGKRLNLGTIVLVGVVAMAAVIGRQLGRSAD